MNQKGRTGKKEIITACIVVLFLVFSAGADLQNTGNLTNGTALNNRLKLYRRNRGRRSQQHIKYNRNYHQYHNLSDRDHRPEQFVRQYHLQ